MTTLLIWEEVPEDVKLVLIPSETLTAGDLDVLRLAHGHYLNGGATDEQAQALHCLSNALTANPKYLAPEHPVGSRWAMRFASFIVPADKSIEGATITHVFRCGWIL